MRKILEGCPSCGADVEIRRLACTRCDTEVVGRFRPCDFCRLSDDQATFLRLFVATRGNLTELEKRLGVSYPTVRAKLDELIARLGQADPAAAPPAHGRRDLLERVARGEVSAAEAARQLREHGV